MKVGGPEMGLFDRFRSAAPSRTDDGKPDTAEQDATRLIDRGHALEAQGKLDEAMQCYLDAIRLAPNPARGHLNRGNVLLLQGDLDGALKAFHTALEHQPDYAGAYYNIGNALLGNRQLDEAVASYRSALRINPDYAEVHCSLGVALKELGQCDEAVASYRRALDIQPDFFEGHLNLGNVMHAMKHSKEAVVSYRRALEIQPDFAEAYNCLGLALQDLGQSGGALDAFKVAIKYKPDHAEAHNNLGIVLQDIGKLDDAMASYRLALSIKPDLTEAHCNLSIALRKLGQMESAMVNCERALEIDPDSFHAYCHMGNILTDLGQFDRAETTYRRALEIKPDYLEAHSNLLLTLNYADNHAPLYRLEQARQYGRVVASKVGTRFSEWQCDVQPGRLRVGLVSGDLRKHPVGYFLEGLLANIDPTRIELLAYPTNPNNDDLSARIRPYFSAWHSLFGKNDEAAAHLIHADGVHILIDLSCHTAYNRLPVFAWKPVPVQVSWLGLPATTGVAEMDYVLGDSWAIPAESENQFSEAVWRMPESYLCLTVPDQSVDVVPPPALVAGCVNFGSFNNLTKMTDAVVAVWARILHSVPDSQLLLKTKQLKDPATREQTRQRFAACGIAPDRLVLGGMLTSRDDHLAAYNKVDIALDTFPYPGVTTSVEALWMGVPVLSMQGNSFLSCTAASIAHNAGLPDWIAADEADYVAKAVAYASDLERLAALRSVLRQQVLASPLFDAPRFARNFEDALWGMWQRYQAGHEGRGS